MPVPNYTATTSCAFISGWSNLDLLPGCLQVTPAHLGECHQHPGCPIESDEPFTPLIAVTDPDVANKSSSDVQAEPTSAAVSTVAHHVPSPGESKTPIKECNTSQTSPAINTDKRSKMCVPKTAIKTDKRSKMCVPKTGAINQSVHNKEAMFAMINIVCSIVLLGPFLYFLCNRFALAIVTLVSLLHLDLLVMALLLIIFVTCSRALRWVHRHANFYPMQYFCIPFRPVIIY